MGVRGAIRTALYGKLTTSGGTALWGTRVYYKQAPQSAATPYVVFDHISGGDANMAPSRIVDTFFQAICYTHDAATARTGGEYIEAALQDASLTVTGYTAMGCSQNDFISTAQTIEGVQWWGEGGEYRIRVNS